MASPQYASAWAICHDNSGLRVFTVRDTRKDAIAAFMKVAEGKGNEHLWRRYRAKGWRAAHISIQEQLFQKGNGHAE